MGRAREARLACEAGECALGLAGEIGQGRGRIWLQREIRDSPRRGGIVHVGISGLVVIRIGRLGPMGLCKSISCCALGKASQNSSGFAQAINGNLAKQGPDGVRWDAQAGQYISIACKHGSGMADDKAVKLHIGPTKRQQILTKFSVLFCLLEHSRSQRQI